MKVVAFNGSPRAASGCTHRVLAPFLEGAADAGAETEYVFLAEQDIHYCTGELHCLFVHPGRCIWDDAMTRLLPLAGSADVLVLASPVYFEGPTAQLKAFVDRLAPLLDPAADLLEGDCHRRLHKGHHIAQTVLVSACGDWGVQMFDRLVDWTAALARSLGSEFAGALLRPHAPYMEVLEQRGESLSDVYEAAREAGRQIVSDGQISSEAFAAISHELLGFDDYVQGFKDAFQQTADRQPDPPAGEAPGTASEDES